MFSQIGILCEHNISEQNDYFIACISILEVHGHDTGSNSGYLIAGVIINHNKMSVNYAGPLHV